MDPRDILDRLHRLGLVVRLRDEGLGVSPSGRITQEVRDLIRDHRDAIANALRSGYDPVESAKLDDVLTAWTPPDGCCWALLTVVEVADGRLMAVSASEMEEDREVFARIAENNQRASRRVSGGSRRRK